MGRNRHGKIHSLPSQLHEEVNLRLLAGKELRGIAKWLNAQEEVRAMLAEQFGGQPVTFQCLSDWKRHGHREWLARREALEDARTLKAEATELHEATGGVLADQIAEVMMARLMRAFRNWDGSLQSKSGKELMMLRGLCREAVEMRRGSHSAARLQIEREHLELEQRSQDAFMKAEFDKWLATPEAEARALKQKRDARWRQNRLREIYGIGPDEPPRKITKGITRASQNKIREALGMEPLPDPKARANGSSHPDPAADPDEEPPTPADDA